MELSAVLQAGYGRREMKDLSRGRLYFRSCIHAPRPTLHAKDATWAKNHTARENERYHDVYGNLSIEYNGDISSPVFSVSTRGRVTTNTEQDASLHGSPYDGDKIWTI